MRLTYKYELHTVPNTKVYSAAKDDGENYMKVGPSVPGPASFVQLSIVVVESYELYETNRKNQLITKISSHIWKFFKCRLLQKIFISVTPSAISINITISTYNERRSASENCIIDNSHCIVFSF